MRKVLVAVTSGLIGMLASGLADVCLAQGVAPYPDRDTGERGWSPSPPGRAVPEAEQPAPGRGRPPGFLGELKSTEPAPPARIPDRSSEPTWRPPADRGTEPPRDPAPPRREAMPRETAPRDSEREILPWQRDPRGSETPRDRREAMPSGRRGPAPTVTEPLSERGRAVETVDLAPVLGADGSRLPHDLWRGLNVGQIEELLAGLAIPPRSAALHDLWRRLVAAKVPEPTGGKTPSHFLSLRLEALYRSGLLKELDEFTASIGAASEGDPILEVQRAKAMIGLGRRDEACARAKATRYQGEVPRAIGRDALLIIAWCAAARGNPAAASLTADLAREQGMEAPLAYAVIDHLAHGGKGAPKLALGKDVSLLDYRFLELAKLPETTRVLDKAEPALLAALARETATGQRTRIEAAEDAARIHALDAEALAAIYRAEQLSPAALADPMTSRLEPPVKRAALLQAVAAEKEPARKARLMRAFLQEARGHQLYVPAARLMRADLEQLAQKVDVAFFAETAVEIALAAGDYQRAVSWALFGSHADRSGRGDTLLHWLTLIDVAGAKGEVPRGSGLKLTEELALAGKFAPEVLHRLVTVLDALEYNVPIPLWNAASRTPQPAKGHLPETGVLSALKAAASDKRFAHTILLAMRALGPDGAEGAHMIALGDAIRALKLVGLEEDARRLGFEALFAAWPRGMTQ
jgi:hypothetical protein